MINQHAYEPRRKSLELSLHTVVVFLTDALTIASLEIEPKNGDRLLRWEETGRRASFQISNVGEGYANHDEIRPEGGFDLENLRRDIAASRENLRPEILAALESASA